MVKYNGRPNVSCHSETKFAARRDQRQRSEESRKVAGKVHCEILHIRSG